MEVSKRSTGLIRQRLLKQIYSNEGVISAQSIAAEVGVTPAAVYKQLASMEKLNLIASVKVGRTKKYSLVDSMTYHEEFLTEGLMEDWVLTKRLQPLLEGVSSTVRGVFGYVFTEMLNNAIEHSCSEKVVIHAYRNAFALGCFISDFGIGIFTKVQQAMNLEQKQYAILELAKGKFTTEPDSHTGEGIFFSSKVADRFCILSDELIFFGGSHDEDEPLLDQVLSSQQCGTQVCFEVELDRTTSFMDIANSFTAAPEDYGFSKTTVPVRLLEYREQSPLFISRSQAKRLIARFDKFEKIVLDFKGVEEIGQGFADEIFRVFVQQHPSTALSYINASNAIEIMILRVRSNL